ncbi:MAG: hypothetical protein ACE367_13390 [Acidimicrobiales bacterium]
MEPKLQTVRWAGLTIGPMMFGVLAALALESSDWSAVLISSLIVVGLVQLFPRGCRARMATTVLVVQFATVLFVPFVVGAGLAAIFLGPLGLVVMVPLALALAIAPVEWGANVVANAVRRHVPPTTVPEWDPRARWIWLTLAPPVYGVIFVLAIGRSFETFETSGPALLDQLISVLIAAAISSLVVFCAVQFIAARRRAYVSIVLLGVQSAMVLLLVLLSAVLGALVSDRSIAWTLLSLFVLVAAVCATVVAADAGERPVGHQNGNDQTHDAPVAPAPVAPAPVAVAPVVPAPVYADYVVPQPPAPPSVRTVWEHAPRGSGTVAGDLRMKQLLDAARWAGLTIGPMVWALLVVHALGGSFEPDERLKFGDTGPAVTLMATVLINTLTVLGLVEWLPSGRRALTRKLVFAAQFVLVNAVVAVAAAGEAIMSRPAAWALTAVFGLAAVAVGSNRLTQIEQRAITRPPAAPATVRVRQR